MPRPLLTALALLLPALPTPGQAPPWWTSEGILDIDPGTGQPVAPADFGVANLGQLKHLAAGARNHLDAHLPGGGAGTAINTMVDAWSAPEDPANPRVDFGVLNLGQLKAVSAPYYDRLVAQRFVAGYPWAVAPDGDPADFGVANLGQLKNLFSFDLSTDTDTDGIPDMWEDFNGLDPADPADAHLDPDGDLAPNWNEYQGGTDPSNTDTDGDGAPDGEGGFGDLDLDGLTNDHESQLGTDPVWEDHPNLALEATLTNNL